MDAKLKLKLKKILWTKKKIGYLKNAIEIIEDAGRGIRAKVVRNKFLAQIILLQEIIQKEL